MIQKAKCLLFVCGVILLGLHFLFTELDAQIINSQISTNTLLSIKFLKGGTGFAIGDSGTVLVTKDFGNTWNIQDITTKIPLRSIIFLNDSLGFIVGGDYNQSIGQYEGVILKTTDRGNSWSVVQDLPYEMLYCISFVDDSVGYAVGSASYPTLGYSGVIKKSTDRGRTWINLNSNTRNPLYALQFPSREIGYVVGNSISLKTTDAGLTWTDQTAGPRYFWPTLHTVHFFNDSVGLELGQNEIIRTINGGTTWTTITRGGGASWWWWWINAVYFFSPDEGIAVNDNGEFIWTSDHGVSWTITNSGISQPLYALDIPERSKGFAVGANGILVKFNIDSIINIKIGGLVAYYPFNGDANDLSGSGNDGTNNGATLTADRLGIPGKAFSFDGISNYIQKNPASFIFNYNSKFTVSAWFKPSSFIGTRTIISHATEASGNFVWSVMTDNGNLCFAATRQTSDWYIVKYQLSNSTLNIWQHLVGVYDNMSMKLYYNGVFVKDTTFGYTNTTAASLPINIGANQFGSMIQYFAGSLDDIRIYDRALNVNEIDSLYYESGWAGKTPPAIPQNLTATASNVQIELRWNKNTETDFLKYRIYIGTDLSSVTLKDSSSASIIDTTKTITGLINGMTYYFRVSALDSARIESGKSIAVSATPFDLVAYYPFNGNANDESGNSNHGTNHGATLTVDRFGIEGKAYSFDGTNSYINIPSLNNLQYYPITYSVWINAKTFVTVMFDQSSTSGFNAIIGRDSSGNTSQGILLLWKQIAPPWSTNIDNKLLYYTGGTSLLLDYTPPLNTWIHLVYTVDRNNRSKWFINGQLMKDTTFIASQNANINFNIGSGGGRGFWNGLIDDIRIYNRALSEAEILSLYNEVPYSTSVNNGGEAAPLKFSLSQNYPNPFNTSTKIDFELPNSDFVRLIVTNLLGQEVAQLVNGVVQRGKHNMNFDASRLPSGVYLYKLYSSGVSITKKLMLLK